MYNYITEVSSFNALTLYTRYWTKLIFSFSIFKIPILRTLEFWNHCQVGILVLPKTWKPLHSAVENIFVCCSGFILLVFCYLVCEFEMGGPEGIVESIQIVKEGKASETEAVDCKWYIRAPPRSKVSPLSTCWFAT